MVIDALFKTLCFHSGIFVFVDCSKSLSVHSSRYSWNVLSSIRCRNSMLSVCMYNRSEICQEADLQWQWVVLKLCRAFDRLVMIDWKKVHYTKCSVLLLELSQRTNILCKNVQRSSRFLEKPVVSCSVRSIVVCE